MCLDLVFDLWLGLGFRVSRVFPKFWHIFFGVFLGPTPPFEELAHPIVKKTTFTISPFGRSSKFDFWRVSWLSLSGGILEFGVDLPPYLWVLWIQWCLWFPPKSYGLDAMSVSKIELLGAIFVRLRNFGGWRVPTPPFEELAHPMEKKTTTSISPFGRSSKFDF